MSSYAIAFFAFLCATGGAVVAVVIARVIPDRHLNAEGRDVMKLGMALVATLAALVLGLLVATAKATFDAQAAAIKQVSADVILLDRILSLYGPETAQARQALRHTVGILVERLSPTGGYPDLALDAAQGDMAAFFAAVAGLSPQQDTQVAIKARAMQTMGDLAKIRSEMMVQSDTSLPTPILAVLLFWVTILFAGYGLLAPRNPTVIAALVVCALSVSGAIFMILELAKPFEGVVHVSSAPLTKALSNLGAE